MVEEVLVENGFTIKEAKVYLAALSGGEISISQIASKTHLKRTTVYSIVDDLKEKGFVSVTKRRGSQQVSSLSPRILIDRFKKSALLAEGILPNLYEMAYSSPVKPRIQFFDGLDGLKHVLREFSYSKIPAMGFTDYHKMPRELFQFIRKEIIPERKRNQNRAKFIIPENETNRIVQSEDAKYFSEHRIIHFPETENPIELLLFGRSEIAFLSFAKEEMFGLVIDSSAIYKTLKNIFQFVWNAASR